MPHIGFIHDKFAAFDSLAGVQLSGIKPGWYAEGCGGFGQEERDFTPLPERDDG